jgi:hypothetical protein
MPAKRLPLRHVQEVLRLKWGSGLSELFGLGTRERRGRAVGCSA